MREMKDSGVEWIGKIPRDWSVECLKYIYNKANVGESIDKDYTTDDDNDYVFYTAGLKPIHTKYCDFPRNKYTKEHDLLLARNGTPYVYLPNNNSVYSDHIIRISIENNVDRRFVRYSLQQAIESLKVEVVSIATWSISLWKKQKLPLPQLVVQQRIADYLDSKCSQIDLIIEKQKQIIEKLKEYKTSLITEVVTKGLDPNGKMKDSGVEWIGNYPQNWSLLKLKHNFGLKGRIGWQGLRSDEFIDDGPFLITGTDFVNGYVNWNTCAHISEERYMQDSNIHIKENDLLITKDGTIGKVAIVKNCPPQVSLNSGVAIIRHTGLFPCFSKYFYYILKSNQFDLWFKLSDNGNSTIKHLTQEKFYNFIYTCPPEIEQRQIADYLDSKLLLIDESIAKKEQIIEKLQEYKKSLIYEVVTGKREV